MNSGATVSQHLRYNLKYATFEYEVKAILSTIKKRGKVFYFVKWKGYPDHENTPQSNEDLTNVKELLNSFKALRVRSP